MSSKTLKILPDGKLQVTSTPMHRLARCRNGQACTIYCQFFSLANDKRAFCYTDSVGSLPLGKIENPELYFGEEKRDGENTRNFGG